MQIFQNTTSLSRPQDISRWSGTLTLETWGHQETGTSQKCRQGMSHPWTTGILWVISSGFCRHLSSITNLLKKNTPFVWSNKCQSALDYLREIFCNKPLLQFPDLNKPYILYMEASNNAYKGILCQPIDREQDIRPVAYFSGTFTAQNKN